MRAGRRGEREGSALTPLILKIWHVTGGTNES